MTTLTDLEERLRRGLQAAGEALPAGSQEPPIPEGRDHDGHERPPRRPSSWHRRVVGAAALVVAGGLVTAGVVASGGNGDERPAVRSGAETTAQPTTTEPHVPRPTNGMVPGQAVIMGNELRTYGPDGTQTGTVDLSRFTNIQAASSDLDGGWVVCGSRDLTEAEIAEIQREIDADIAAAREALEAEQRRQQEQPGGDPPETTPDGRTVPEVEADLDSARPAASTDELVWYPADRDPVVLGESPFCMASSIHVVDSADGPMAVFGAMDMAVSVGAPSFVARSIVLATGEERDLPIPGSSDLLRWSVTSDRFLTAGPDGTHLYDLATGEEQPMADIPVADASDVVLSGDGRSVAVITGGASGPTDVSVYDVATGAQRFTEHLPMAAEGAELSYDGTTLAYGNYYADYGPVTVVDLASGARHTIDAHGVVL
jgi:hypothetical protein